MLSGGLQTQSNQHAYWESSHHLDYRRGWWLSCRIPPLVTWMLFVVQPTPPRTSWRPSRMDSSRTMRVVSVHHPSYRHPSWPSYYVSLCSTYEVYAGRQPSSPPGSSWPNPSNDPPHSCSPRVVRRIPNSQSGSGGVIVWYTWGACSGPGTPRTTNSEWTPSNPSTIPRSFEWRLP